MYRYGIEIRDSRFEIHVFNDAKNARVIGSFKKICKSFLKLFLPWILGSQPCERALPMWEAWLGYEPSCRMPMSIAQAVTTATGLNSHSIGLTKPTLVPKYLDGVVVSGISMVFPALTIIVNMWRFAAIFQKLQYKGQVSNYESCFNMFQCHFLPNLRRTTLPPQRCWAKQLRSNSRARCFFSNRFWLYNPPLLL